ncbi:uncharacterized protein LOC132037584 [Lycium ferocissimum]|uniref:uncharacterized protein LOC132037584 n=1 Tax=Lycium ferocissimum TaxID=112874 RepID=UPI0028150B6E|nr:uncharacterized protein LOC132037584 [Lycium ferocissimum]
MHYVVVFFNWRSIGFPVYVQLLFKRSLYITCSLCKRCTLQQGKSCFCFRIFLQVSLNWSVSYKLLLRLITFTKIVIAEHLIIASQLSAHSASTNVHATFSGGIDIL